MKVTVANMVPMSDGVRLATDVWLPDGPGPFPTLLVRTPYHRRRMPPLYVEHGYALVVQDCRGKFDSEGVFTPLADEARDGQDTIAWIAEQRWCNGRIGMFGGSYLGFVQVPAAAGGHEALRCIVPQVASASFFRHWTRYDGCPSLCNAICWNLGSAVSRTKTTPWHFNTNELFRASTLEELFDLAGFECDTLRNFYEHDRYDEYWAGIDQFPMHEKIKVPAYHMGSWFDHFIQGQCETYGRIRDLGATDAARAGQRLLIGPWGHAAYATSHENMGVQNRRYGEWEFPEEACVSVRTFEKRFLDLYLKDRDDGFGEEPPVRVFLMGANHWIDLADWPPDAEVQAWHLRSEGAANTQGGPGRLTRESPGREPPDTYTYDPRDPMPTRGGPVYQGIEARGPMDQRPLFDRSDFVYYRSEPLPGPLTLIGNIELDLWVASSAVDTDFIARLCVLEPSGAVTCFTYGSLRCKYRESWSEPKPLEPGAATQIRIQMGHTAYVFPKGSRIALLITSSCYPRILPNPNTMARPFSGEEPVTARQQILHDAEHPSCLHLPVLEV